MPDRLFAKFYIETGLKPKAEHYKLLENEMLTGHSLGHYLISCTMMFQATGDTLFLKRVNYIVNELGKLQEAARKGYIGAFTNRKKIFEEEIVKGDISSQGFDLNCIWSPFYTYHKSSCSLKECITAMRKPDIPVALVLEYGGGFPGAKTFDILVNDILIATENISGKREGQFINVQYDIPEEIPHGKSKMKVEFLPILITPQVLFSEPEQ